jgi:hypothetical protein
MRLKQLSLSLLSVGIVAVVAFTVRFSYFTNESRNGYNATTWDALGYYMYLPGYLIYDDATELKWFPEIDKKYGVSGGELYQATKLEKGGYAFKYLGGVAIMELPFFYIGHGIAYLTDAPEDGFSWPYQYAVMFGAVFWFLAGCLILRKVLLRFYSETVTSLTLLLICLSTNILQYVSVDGAMSHAFIFPLYAGMLWLTIRWHEAPKVKTALAIGFVAGLATISRPTELIIVFIPILWSLEKSGSLKSKWALVRAHRAHLLWAIAGGLAGILPQLLYWKHATGSWIYDVGSKWYFLNPWFRVLFGFEKGWFIYTPIAVFMIAGLFLLKGKPFRKAVITFTILNIWIIISWSDWRYGASYSTRALTQSYPVLALALGGFIERFYTGRKRWLITGIGGYLTFVNLFQIRQYNATVLHYDDMNFRYYKAIYLDRNPTPLDYSLLDTDELLNESKADVTHAAFFKKDTIRAQFGSEFGLAAFPVKNERWVKVELSVTSLSGMRTASLTLKCFVKGRVVKEKRFRFTTPKSKEGEVMQYACYLYLPVLKSPLERTEYIAVGIDSFDTYEGKNALLKVTGFR